MESKKEGIVFSKTGWIEKDLKIYENYFHEGYPHIALMVYNRYMISKDLSVPDIEYELYPENYKDEIQFYSRSYKDYNTYTDWNKYKIVNYTQILRDIKLKEILND